MPSCAGRARVRDGIDLTTAAAPSGNASSDAGIQALAS
jgi:hypothetical protein